MAQRNQNILKYFKYFPVCASQLNAFILFCPKIFMAIHSTSASYVNNVLLDVLEGFCFTHCYPTIQREEFIVRMLQMIYGIVMVTTKLNNMAFPYMVESVDFQGRLYG